MRLIKLILFIVIFFVFCDNSNAYTLKIYKTFLSHDPGGLLKDYNYVNRAENLERSPIDPNVILSKTVNIFCEGNGTLSCPNSITAPSDIGVPPNFMTIEAINAAQSVLNSQMFVFEENGTKNNSSGTIVTPDGLHYYYTVIWTTLVSGQVDFELTFSSINI